MATSNLGITEVTPAQADKVTVINEALEQLDRAGNQPLDIPVVDAVATVISVEDFTNNLAFVLDEDSTTPATADFTVDVPASNRLFLIVNNTAFEATIQITGGAGASVTVPTGEAFTIFSNGIDVISVGGGGGGSIGVQTFLALTDTPSAFSGESGRFVAVNSAEDALEFVNAPSGGGSGVVGAPTLKTRIVPNANQTTSGATQQELNFDTSLFDDANLHNAGDSFFTIPAELDGKRVKFRAATRATSGTGGSQLGIERLLPTDQFLTLEHNSSAIIVNNQTESPWVVVAAGETYRVTISTNGGSRTLNANLTYFEAEVEATSDGTSTSASRPSLFAYLNTAVTGSSGGINIPYDTVDYDVDNAFDLGTDEITIPAELDGKRVRVTAGLALFTNSSVLATIQRDTGSGFQDIWPGAPRGQIAASGNLGYVFSTAWVTVATGDKFRPFVNTSATGWDFADGGRNWVTLEVEDDVASSSNVNSRTSVPIASFVRALDQSGGSTTTIDYDTTIYDDAGLSLSSGEITIPASLNGELIKLKANCYVGVVGGNADTFFLFEKNGSDRAFRGNGRISQDASTSNDQASGYIETSWIQAVTGDTYRVICVTTDTSYNFVGEQNWLEVERQIS